MIETPLFGRFQGENKRLVFSAPPPYHALVRGCIITGCVMVLIGLVVPLNDAVGLFSPSWWLLIGTLVTVAGIAASLSLTSISFNLQERQYRRRQGPGFFKSLRVGSVNELDAIVLISEPNTMIPGGGVTYHLVLHWKNNAQPIMVLQNDSRAMPPGAPLNSAVQQILNQGVTYARALNLPFFDNSHFPSKCPIPLW